jgi:hypothetical protein
MKNILIISLNGSPVINANTNCIDLIIKGLGFKDYNFDVFSFKINGESLSFDNCNHHTFRSLGFDIYHTLLKIYNKGGIFRIPLIIYSKISNFLTFVFLEGYLSIFSYRKIKQKYLQLTKIKKYDFILSFSLPFISHIVAKRLHSLTKSVKWIAYELDPFSYNYSLSQKFTGLRKIVEMKTLSSSAKIITLPYIDSENSQKNFRTTYSNKTTKIYLPNLFIPENIPTPSKTIYDFCYSGQFYGIRHPGYMLEFLKKYTIGKKILFVGCTFPKDSLITLSELKNSNEVTNLSWQKKDLNSILIKESKVLINISNNLPNQMPSKILEFISLNKPIINFYYRDDDPSFIYLNRYKLVFNVKVESELNDSLRLRFEKFYSVIYQESHKKSESNFTDLDNSFIVSQIKKVLSDLK